MTYKQVNRLFLENKVTGFTRIIPRHNIEKYYNIKVRIVKKVNWLGPPKRKKVKNVKKISKSINK